MYIPLDKGIASLVRIVRKTEELNFIRLRQLTGDGLKSLASRALRQLGLQESYGISEAGFMTLIKNCPNIEKLSISELHNLSDTAFVCIADTLGAKLVRASILQTATLSLVLFVVGGVGCYGTEPCNFVWNYSTGHTLHQPQNVMVIEGNCIILYIDASI